ncbi:hypothetical protein LCGC14_0946180 [marine sediment metagenome]|uniref:Uncharacterized protein n=1 Tax=marine sediment metagenome TaxID=412755 RepID=A0A0F9P4S7_9ZZZZ
MKRRTFLKSILGVLAAPLAVMAAIPKKKPLTMDNWFDELENRRSKDGDLIDPTSYGAIEDDVTGYLIEWHKRAIFYNELLTMGGRENDNSHTKVSGSPLFL